MAGDLFIFTTQFDEALSVSALPKGKIHLFTTIQAQEDTLTLLRGEDLPFLPGPWMLRRSRKSDQFPGMGWTETETIPVKVRIV